MFFTAKKGNDESNNEGNDKSIYELKLKIEINISKT